MDWEGADGGIEVVEGSIECLVKATGEDTLGVIALLWYENGLVLQIPCNQIMRSRSSPANISPVWAIGVPLEGDIVQSRRRVVSRCAWIVHPSRLRHQVEGWTPSGSLSKAGGLGLAAGGCSDSSRNTRC